jgi:hypothetical protein
MYMKTRLYNFSVLTLSIFLVACGSTPKSDSSSDAIFVSQNVPAVYDVFAGRISKP